MSEWLQIGSRFINLRNVCEARYDERHKTVQIVLVGGGAIELRDEEASDLLAALQRTALVPEEPHRTVFSMPGT